ncbi:hypothetical protein [Bradyrhizobium erythrophlei]|uniref:Uncharacterized protein n=1 Tax=Bradyrhizobium erythrophlei TaxID=1437360 RepID=A0A1M5PZS3_9BRAD|nr:hypothetical protein [Bradyrhizobium erythrophlei]SHH07192.1 hypothetical protein SAMN05443248_3581 [Bradyrhizobium erythrophlei]
MEQDNKELLGRIAGMALTKLSGMKSATGVYFKVVEAVGAGEVKVICTNPGLQRMERTFPASRVRDQLRPEIIQVQLDPVSGELLDYVAKCYLTERQTDENDETLKARLHAFAMGPKAMH